CSNAATFQHIDIGKIASVKSTFGPPYKVVTTGPTGIDPRLLARQGVPPGVTFDPPSCAQYAGGQTLPQGLKGNMAAVSAEGEGNRFIAIALETSEPVPYDAADADKCKHVTFSGGALRGSMDVVDAPHIDNAQTLGLHRVLEVTINGTSRSGEIYDYLAYLGNYLVLVTANPVVVPGQPVGQVNVARAQKLFTDAVGAVRR
ncbi:MAG TPA: DUF5642 family protein, partial [Mycobacterium sp.]|nr:DUF5642 family protein [Mycobacterium sp.]